jgi:4-amino-4-deoxy-L-arabinose transferase-like glycosyltransferase
LSLIPTYFFVGFTLNPEAVVLPFLLVGWMALDRMRASTTTPDGARWALLLGGAIGVGFLAKYTAVLMVPIALAYLATGADTRGWFKRPSLYVAGLFALALATPVIVWNAQHHWPTLTLHLVERTARPSLAVYLSNAKTTAISQLLVTQPLMLAIALFGAGYALHRARRDGRYRLLAWAALPSWLFFLVMMVRVRDAEPHWTMSAYLPMVVAAAGAIDEWRAPSMLARRWTRRLVTAAAATSFAVYALAFVHGASPWLTERLPVASHDADPFNESAGWEVNAPALLERARALGPEAPIVGSHNVLCGQLDWQLGAAIEVDCASPRRTAYDFFGRRDPSPSAPALYVDSLRYPEDPAKLLPHHRCGEFSTLTVQRGETEVGTLRLARCLPVSGS